MDPQSPVADLRGKDGLPYDAAIQNSRAGRAARGAVSPRPPSVASPPRSRSTAPPGRRAAPCPIEAEAASR